MPTTISNPFGHPARRLWSPTYSDAFPPPEPPPTMPTPTRGDWITIMGVSCVVVSADRNSIYVAPKGCVNNYIIIRHCLTPEIWSYMVERNA